MAKTIFTSFSGFAKASVVLSAAAVLSACAAVDGRWSEYNYGYNDVRSEPVVFDAPAIRVGSGAMATAAATMSAPAAMPTVVAPRYTAGALLPQTTVSSGIATNLNHLPRVGTGFTTGPAAVQIGQLPPRISTTSILPSIVAPRPAPVIASAAPLVATPRVTPTGYSEQAICHSVSDPSAAPIGLPLSSFGYSQRTFLTLPTATEYVQYLYTQREVQPSDHAFANMAAGFDSNSARYARNTLPTMVYNGTINRAVRLNSTQFMVDLAPIPGAPGGLHLCNLNGELEIDRVNQNCCGQPLLIDRGYNPQPIQRTAVVSTPTPTPMPMRVVSTNVVASPAPTTIISKTDFSPNLVSRQAGQVTSPVTYSYSVTPTMAPMTRTQEAQGLMNILNIRSFGSAGGIGSNGLGVFPGVPFSR